MFRSRSLWLASLVATLWLVAPPSAGAQPVTQLKTRGTSGTISANGGSVTLTDTGGLASLTIQALDTYSGTWELQCSTDNGTTYDDDDEITVALVGSTTTAQSVTDTVGIWQANISGCNAVRILATAGFAASNVTLSLQAITPGGGSSGGGAAGAVSITQGGNTAEVNASSQLSVTCANCSGSGVSVLEDAASAAGDAGTPAYTVRNDTVTGATGTDGDYQPMKSDSAGRTYVTGTGGTFPISGTAASDAAVSGNPVAVAGRASAAAPTDVSADGDVVMPWLLRSGAISVQPTFAGVLGVAGNGASGTGVQRVTIANDSTGILAAVTNVATIGTSVTPGGGAAHLGKAEDAAHTSGDTGVMMLGVRQDSAAALAGTTGDYTPPTMTSTGAMRVDVASIGGSAPAAAICDDPAKVTTFNINLGAATGNTELVALNGSDLVYVCNFVYTTGGADTPQLIYGTGSACATGETDLMTFNLAAAGDGVVIPGGGSVITKAPAGNALCLERTNSVTGMGTLTYVRQP